MSGLSKKPTVSIIIPTYNRERWVVESVESIFAQSYSDYELIVVDDGSTDNTYKVLSPFKSKIRYIFQPNSGPALARNTGIYLSRGEWITFLDSDDLWEKRKLEKQIKKLKEEPWFKVCYTEEKWIRNGKRVNPGKKHAKYSGWIYQNCLPLCIISPSSVMIHRSVFKRVGYFDPLLSVAEDYDLWLRITSRYPVQLIQEPLIIKRGGHPDQLSKRYWGIDRFRIIALEKMLKQSHLPLSWQIATLKEIIKKARILANGCRKRKKWKEYQFYIQKIENAWKKMTRLLSL